MGSTHPPLESLLRFSQNCLEGFELSRLNRIAKPPQRIPRDPCRMDRVRNRSALRTVAPRTPLCERFVCESGRSPRIRFIADSTWRRDSLFRASPSADWATKFRWNFRSFRWSNLATAWLSNCDYRSGICRFRKMLPPLFARWNISRPAKLRRSVSSHLTCWISMLLIHRLRVHFSRSLNPGRPAKLETLRHRRPASMPIPIDPRTTLFGMLPHSSQGTATLWRESCRAIEVELASTLATKVIALERRSHICTGSEPKRSLPAFAISTFATSVFALPCRAFAS